jgi:hypothetical protein
MRTGELHEQATEGKGNVDDQSVFIAAEIKDDSVVANEIDSATKLALYLGRICPMRCADNREPCTNRTFGLRVTGPEPLQRPTGDHLQAKLYHVTSLVTAMADYRGVPRSKVVGKPAARSCGRRRQQDIARHFGIRHRRQSPPISRPQAVKLTP